jgi:hypothetical protein
MSIERASPPGRAAGALDLRAAPQSRRRLASLSAAWLIGLSLMTAVNPAKAAWTYAWESGSSFSFEDGVSAAPTGTLSIDPASGLLKSTDELVLTGPGPEAGTYGSDYYDLAETLVFTDGPADLSLLLTDLNEGPNKAPLFEVSWSEPNFPQSEASSVAGGLQMEESAAGAVPEPSAWALLGLGLAAIALGRGRRRDGRRARLSAEIA